MNQYPSKPHKPWNEPGDPFSPHPYSPEQDWKRKQPDTPKPVTISDLFPNLGRLSIGWSPLLSTLKAVTETKPSYPPYDIIDRENDTTVVSVAVAGFTKKDLEVTVHEGILKIEGKKKAKKETGEVVYQGIAARNFTLTFALAEYYEVSSATVEDGMLTITLIKNVPDEKKPKVIDIK